LGAFCDPTNKIYHLEVGGHHAIWDARARGHIGRRNCTTGRSAGLAAFEYLASVEANLVLCVSEAAAVPHQSAGDDVLTASFYTAGRA
jgi:hypothetical protein